MLIFWSKQTCSRLMNFLIYCWNWFANIWLTVFPFYSWERFAWISFLVSFAHGATLLIYFGLFGLCVGVRSFLFVSICLIFAFTICLGFIFWLLSFLFISYFISYFPFCFLFLLLPFIDITNSLQGLGSPTRGQVWALGVGAPSPGH